MLLISTCFHSTPFSPWVFCPGSSHLSLATYSSSALSLPMTYSSFQFPLLLVNAVTTALSSRRKLFRVGRWWRAPVDSTSSVGTSTGSCDTPHIPLVHSPAHRSPESSAIPWCFDNQPTDWGGTFFFLFLLICYYEETFCILRKMCFPLRKEHGYRSTTPIWPLWFRNAKRKTLAPEALIHLPDTFQGSPQAAPATVSLYPAFSGQGNMLWLVQNLSAVNITYSI